MENPTERNQIIPVIDKQKKHLSKLESLFNYRIKRVKRLKDNIQVGKEQIETYKNKRVEKVLPITNEITTTQVEVVNALVEVYDAKIVKGKKQIEKFEKVLVAFLENLIFDKGQKGLEAIYERFAKQTVEEAEEEAIRESKEQFFGMMDFMGIELSKEYKEKIQNSDIDSDFIESIDEKLSEESMMNSDFFKSFGSFGEGKKTRQQIDREKREAEELENISKTVKKVYKELTVELHPDRESNEAKREEKTALMQEITKAYHNDDLFTLLSIQLAQINNTDNTKLSDEKINYFNTMLLNQARELEEQKTSMLEEAGLPEHFSKTLGKKEFEKLTSKHLRKDKDDAEEKLKHTELQLLEIKSKNKQYIKEFVEENYRLFYEVPSFPFHVFDI